MAMLDLTTATLSAVTTGMQVGTTRIFFSNIDRDVSRYAYWPDQTINGDFTHHLGFQCEIGVDTGLVVLWGLAKKVSDFGAIDTGTGGDDDFLALALRRTGSAYELRLYECLNGVTANAVTWEIPVRYRYWPLYATIVRDDDAGEHDLGILNLSVYEDPARTIPITLTIDHLDLHEQLDFTHLYAFSSYYTASAGSGKDMTGWAGEFYLDETPPAMFTESSNAIVANWDDEDDMSVFNTTWTETGAAQTVTDDDHWPDTTTHCAHLWNGDDFEWTISGVAAADGTLVDATHDQYPKWIKTVAGTSTAKLDTGQKNSGTRSLELYRDGTNSPYASIAITAADSAYTFSIWGRVDGTALWRVLHGDGNHQINVLLDASGNLQYYNHAGSLTDTTSDIADNTWFQLEFKNINFTAGTFDLWADLDGVGGTVELLTGIEMHSGVLSTNTILLGNASGTSSCWFDDLRLTMPSAYIATTVNVWEASMAQATVRVVSVPTACKLPLFGLSNGALTTSRGYGVFAVEASGVYYLRLCARDIVDGDGDWGYSTSAVTTPSSYNNNISLNTDYEIHIAHTNNSGEEGWIYLYVRTVGGIWRCVDSLNWCADYTEALHDYTMNYIWVGNMQGLAASVGGEFYLKTLKYHDGASYFPSICRGGAGDTSMIYGYRRSHFHGITEGSPLEFLLSTDDGVTWTSVGTLTDVDHDMRHSRVVWDGTQWIIASSERDDASVFYGNFWYSDAGWTVDVLVTTGIAEETAYLMGSKVIESGDWLVGWYNSTSSHFAKYDISAHTLSKCVVARDADITNYTTSEIFVWRSGTLYALVRWDDEDGDPRLQYKYHKCLDAAGSANEGLNYQTGVADADVLNTLDDTSEDFTISNGTTRLQAVAVGWTVRNTTAGTIAYVTAVAPGGDKSRLTLSADIFPAGTGNYEISCWGAPNNADPSEEYNNKGGLLCAFPWQGYLYMQGYDQDSYRAGVGPITSWISKAADTDMAIYAEKHWSSAGARTPTDDILEYGNGDVDAKIATGNHYIDFVVDSGIAMFFRLDVVDEIAPYLATWNGVTTVGMELNGVTPAEWHGLDWT